MRMRTALAAMAVLAMAGAAAAAPESWLGDWQGQETQVGGGDKAYLIGVTLTENGGATEYPSLHCSGALQRIASHGRYVMFTETITRGDCVPGIVALAPAGARLGWSWFGIAGGEAIYAFATLERRPQS